MSINSTMTALADEVRELSGKAGKLTLENMTDEVASGNGTISGQTSLIAQIAQALEGKAAGNGSKPEQEKTVEITENGEHTITPDEGYTLSKVTTNVNVPDVPAVIEELTISENGTYTAPDGVDGYSPVTVDVPIPDGYIKPNGELEVTENGTHDVTEYASVNVNVKVSGGDEGTNAQWFADLITDSARTVEVYNDKFEGTLSAYAFYERSNVTKIELPYLQYLKERCFFGCQNLKTLLLPGLIGYTYQYMAAGCTALVDVDIHGSSYISSYTFQNCTSLKKVDLHKVGTIATYSFIGATKFDTLIIRTDTVPTLGGTNAFNNTKIKSGGTGYIYVKSALLDEFRAATNWSTYSSQFRAIEDYPEICGTEV